MEGSPDGLRPPTEPHWLARDLAERGGRLSVAAQREPKARHGRREERRLWALSDPELNAYLGWPHLAQVCRVERRRSLVRRGKAIKAEDEVTYLITSAAPERAAASVLLQTNRGHWGIENRSHYVRDVTFDEDRSQLRRGAAPQAFAACKNLAIALLRRRGWANIAEALRCHAGRPYRAVALVASAGITW
jgi:predicted transposase YbfD/YdcC